MNKNFFLILILLIIISGCGYSPTFKNSDNKNIKIEINEMSGDNFINTQIYSRLAVYSNTLANSSFKITIQTDYEKQNLSKDLTGRITNYELKFTAEIDVNFIELSKKIIIEESFLLNNSSDTFNNNENENLIKKDFANIVAEKLMAQLLLISNQ